MSQLFNRLGAERLKKRVIENDSERGQRLAGALYNQMNDLHSIDFFPDYEIEKLLLEQKEHDLDLIKNYQRLPEGLMVFSPSSASACRRGLVFKANKEKKDEVLRYPYQRRWTRNSSAVHEAVQRDLLYSEKILENPVYTVHRLESGLPAWEQNIKTCKVFEHNGVKFAINGMCDGILEYKPDGSKVLFEFKTKSTTIGCVGTYKLKGVQDEHRTQAIAYSLLFGVDEVVFMYESVAKDGWTKGAEAKVDFRTFYVKVTEEDRQQLLDKFSEVAKDFYEKKIPEKEDKCFFCVYKEACERVGE
ncbi:PD-(D/E)XK nuclease family protein [Clostridium perfringens]|uniref:PD-(D/E)XK nuclease family protein n=1 Tax=Clostridium perfringens TaxID=1502 RepID=UPI0029739AE2|nr:PD-(D/E)XK nuclease family protein [Clostridium perfringens]MDK0835027.1 PD-(D/E)XK nuclease family protein [Clostridium perfringens]MDK0928428.1 PD-(D/E)XK nuclease family protein [Clostridium perfringens]MDM0495348.1 PD-(D/E)XK nuclease family protein [Clostridium perfringens]MDM0781064.1 PD-(D/E)XK nuclease family protein [Clostridium perfringens]